jgi:putative flippase GtrA
MVTWLLNSSFTFARTTSLSVKSFARYCFVQTAGSLINILVFYTIIHYVPVGAQYPVLALAVASLIAMLFNYATLKKYVYPPRKLS